MAYIWEDEDGAPYPEHAQELAQAVYESHGNRDCTCDPDEGPDPRCAVLGLGWDDQ